MTRRTETEPTNIQSETPPPRTTERTEPAPRERPAAFDPHDPNPPPPPAPKPSANPDGGFGSFG